MAAGSLLATLPQVKEYLALVEDTSDGLLQRMIRGASAHILNYCNRSTIALTEYSEVYDGYGNSFMVLRNNPVYSIEALSFAGTSISAATGDGFTTPYNNGFVVDPSYDVGVGAQRLNLYGWAFPRLRASVSVRYKAGYVLADEAHTVPSATPFVVTTDYTWTGDVGVKYADGTLFVKVASAPAQGEYSVTDGVYTFNELDADVEVLITYGYVPADLNEAAVMMVGERYKYMERIGVVSKSLGGQETVSFSQKSMPEYVKDALIPYINVTPI